MNAEKNGARITPLLVLCFLAATAVLAGCEGDDGVDGLDGADGTDGAAGAAGLSCWDLNANGIADADEDLNGDGTVDAIDCNAIAGGAYDTESLHAGYFTEHDYSGSGDCLDCHGLEGSDLLMKAHYTWEGTASNVAGFEGESHGKNDFINNFCIAVPSNEGRCSQCHAGYGYDDKTFAFNDPDTVDCLVCHDQTGTYVKGKKSAGLPEAGVDLGAVARSVGANGGRPGLRNCVPCHANAGGGDNVKHGDIAMAILDTTREYDVHLGKDGAGFDCVTCHGVKKDVDGELIDHGIGGLPYHSIDEGDMKACEDCHGDVFNIHVGSPVEPIVASHTSLACEVCHIPAIARQTSTKVEWYWSDAGLELGTPPDPATGRPTHDKMKGTFVWATDVRPTLLYHDGKWNRFIIGDNDKYTEIPVVLAEPAADYTTPGAKIYPFKKMIGNQPADANNDTMLVPHLFGKKGGPNPFWGVFDWDLALQDGAAYTSQTYSGDYLFVDTVMYLGVNHEIAPKEMAYGQDGACNECHFENKIDWTALGWSDDPLLAGGSRP